MATGQLTLYKKFGPGSFTKASHCKSHIAPSQVFPGLIKAVRITGCALEAVKLRSTAVNPNELVLFSWFGDCKCALLGTCSASINMKDILRINIGLCNHNFVRSL